MELHGCFSTHYPPTAPVAAQIAARLASHAFQMETRSFNTAGVARDDRAPWVAATARAIALRSELDGSQIT